MLSIDEAVGIIKANAPGASIEDVSIENALGRTLARDIPAPEPSPRNTNSAMDGFAVKWEDIGNPACNPPCRLSITGESKAGEPFLGRLRSGQAVRISTGAVLPDGADTVIPVEDTSKEGDVVIIRSADRKGRHVRAAGEEFQRDEVILHANARLSPAGIGMLAVMGIKTISVFKRPDVAIIVTGSEFPSSGESVHPWQIRDSNGVMLSSAVLYSGGRPALIGPVRDVLVPIKGAIQEALEKARIILVSGGVSVGPHDLVKLAAGEIGFETLFWRVRQKPGKPLFFAKKADALLFGLPGNPVSALICYAYYVHPLLAQVQRNEFTWNTISAVLGGDYSNSGGRTQFIRCRLVRQENGELQAVALKRQSSHMLSSMVDADGFFLMEPEERLSGGSDIKVYLFPWTGFFGYAGDN